jgi:hypothetical protein
MAHDALAVLLHKLVAGVSLGVPFRLAAAPVDGDTARSRYVLTLGETRTTAPDAWVHYTRSVDVAVRTALPLARTHPHVDALSGRPVLVIALPASHDPPALRRHALSVRRQTLVVRWARRAAAALLCSAATNGLAMALLGWACTSHADEGGGGQTADGSTTLCSAASHFVGLRS